MAEVGGILLNLTKTSASWGCSNFTQLRESTASPNDITGQSWSKQY